MIKYPLIDWNITEKQALEYCYSKGFNWSGLYEKFKDRLLESKKPKNQSDE
jgi:hypothetical protein